jgi:hypothetical protein
MQTRCTRKTPLFLTLPSEKFPEAGLLTPPRICGKACEAGDCYPELGFAEHRSASLRTESAAIWPLCVFCVHAPPAA